MKIIRILWLIVACLSHPAWGVELKEKEIIRVVDKGEIDQLKSWLDQGLDINWVDYKGRSLLERASGRGHEAMVDELLKRGAEVNQEDQEGNTSLYMAVRGGYIDIVRKLISHKANVNQRDGRGVSALYMAAKKGFDEIVELLCSEGVIVSPVIEETKETPLGIAARKGHSSVISILLKYGANPNQGDYKGITPLLISTYFGHEKAALTLLEGKADPNQPRDNGITPLMLAGYTGLPKLVKNLIDRGANLDTYAPPELGGGKALHYALQAKPNILPQNYHAVIDILEGAAQKKQIQEQEKLAALEQQITNLQNTLSNLSQSQEDIKKNQEKVTEQILSLSPPPQHSNVEKEQKCQKKQIQEQEKLTALEQQIANLQNTLSSLSQSQKDLKKNQEKATEQILSLSPPPQRSDIEKKLKRFKKQLNVLWEKHTQEQDLQKRKDYLKGDESLNKFYTTFHRKLSHLFLAYNVLDTGMVEKTKTTLNKVADGIELLGEVIEIPFIRHIPKVVSTGLNLYADKREENKISLVARLTHSLSEMEKEVEETSLLISYRYENQIKRLTIEGSQTLAECGVRRLIEYIRDDKVDQKGSLASQLTYALSIHNSRQGKFPFTHKRLDTKDDNNNKKWTDNGVFKKAGIKTSEGKKYTSLKTREFKYGYRLGTKEEALELGLTEQ